jgi:Holliday junction resolvase
MSRRSRDKGNAVERAIVAVAALQQHGFTRQRVPLSGAARGLGRQRVDPAAQCRVDGRAATALPSSTGGW